MALLAGPTGAIHLKRSLKVLLFNKSLAGPTGALTLNRFLSRCKDRYYFIKFQGIRILFSDFHPKAQLIPIYFVSLPSVRGEIRTNRKHSLLFRVQPSKPKGKDGGIDMWLEFYDKMTDDDKICCP